MGAERRERGILFSAPMVRKLPGIEKDPAKWKTQTRRVVTVPWRGARRALPYEPYWVDTDGELFACDQYGDYHRAGDVMQPYGVPGDLLWVREAWAVERCYDHLAPRDIPRTARVLYGHHVPANRVFVRGYHRTRSPLHMPHWASRLVLRIVSVRAERLKDISEEDARAEGVREIFVARRGRRWEGADDGAGPLLFATAADAFASLWDSINGHRPGASWAESPWVWRIEFDRADGGGS